NSRLNKGCDTRILLLTLGLRPRNQTHCSKLSARPPRLNTRLRGTNRHQNGLVIAAKRPWICLTGRGFRVCILLSVAFAPTARSIGCFGKDFHGFSDIRRRWRGGRCNESVTPSRVGLLY